IKLKGSKSGAVTDLNGNFTVAAKNGQMLEVSYIGYTTKNVKVNGSKKLDIALSEDAHSLSEVVVVGYGVMKRSDLTGSVASINEEQIKQGVN
ncbi:carboxypeptidase-like regulatory domain-containing protein, partial [Nocardia cyriacigeorgica]|nr:carboxypeptidase-like regulatory domain-containing protein [Nocardia cyriacigeorgica]